MRRIEAFYVQFKQLISSLIVLPTTLKSALIKIDQICNMSESQNMFFL